MADTLSDYDPAERRSTPLAIRLCETMPPEGLPLADYMRVCLLDPEHGYYNRRSVLGRDGDFITAPEISQAFGELIGLWAAVTWRQMGAPSAFDLIELGPGRGTLMADALRAAHRVPGFTSAVNLHLVEASPRMRELQRETLADCGVALAWADTICDDAPHAGSARPAIILANEFLDCLPIDQVRWKRGTDGAFDWSVRHVSVDKAELIDIWVPLLDGDPHRPLLPSNPPECAIVEFAHTAPVIAAVAARATVAPLAALFIDYGYGAGSSATGASGDTLQAVRAHAYEHPLTAPGLADLSAHVDFAALARDVARHGLAVDGPATQAEFLGRLGIVERAAKLMASNPGKAAAIEAGIARLIAPGGMGTRFKALGIRSPDLTRLPGL